MCTNLELQHVSGHELRTPALCVHVLWPDADTVVLSPVGEADCCTLPHLRQALSEAIGSARSRIIVDLDGLTFMDASTLGALVDARRRVSEVGGSLQVRCHTRWARHLLSITDLLELLEPEPPEVTAPAAVGRVA